MTIYNFSEIVGSENEDNLVGFDLEVLYGLKENDTLTTVEGSSPLGLTTTFLVGGSGDDQYQIGNNSTAIIIENGDSSNDKLQATGIGLLGYSSIYLEINYGRHLYIGDFESNQFALLMDWQDRENRIETFEFQDGTYSYEQIVDNFRLSPGYLGDITDEFEERELELMDADIAIINTRNAVLESDDIRDENLIEFYRFRNTNFETGTYLFVAQEERNAILANPNFNRIFTLEGITDDLMLNSAFVASTVPGEKLLPFYRLRSLDVPGTYLFVSTDEYQTIFADDSPQQDKWVKEGLGNDGIDIPEFYLYGAGVGQGLEFHDNT